MKQRAITALFFVAAMVGGVYGGRVFFFPLCVVIAGGCLWELMSLLIDAEEPHSRVRKILGSSLGLLPLLWWGNIFNYATCGLSTDTERTSGFWEAQLYHGSLILYATTVLLFLLFVFELFSTAKKPFQHLGAYALGFFYITLPIMLLLSLAATGGTYAPNRVFGLLVLVWTNDTLAYLVGSRFGKTKLFERISPKKTWEGTIGGIIGAIAMAWGLAQVAPDYNPAQWLALGLVVSVFGTLGDLAESMLKRSAGVKDSGNLFPGHGGFLDRFDAFLFMLPFAWLVVTLLV